MAHRTTWLDFRTRDHKCFLREHPRAYSALRTLSYPATQRPQMVTLLGGVRKTQLIRGLFLNTIGTGHNRIHLHLVPGFEESHDPTILADCELHNAQSFTDTLASGPSDVEEHSLRWHRNMLRDCEPPTLASLVYTHVMLPFCTTLCFFADDYAGTRKVAEVLSSWIVGLSSRSSEVAPSALPRVLVLSARGRGEGGFDEKLATLDFMQELRQETESKDKSIAQVRAGRLRPRDFEDLLRQQFSGIRVLLTPFMDADTSHLQRLRSRILQESQEVQDHRISSNIAFSIPHFQSLLHLACAHFATDIVTTFNFVKATRSSNPVPSEFPKHINKFLRLVPPRLTLSFGIPVVASAMAMDSHPPNMHVFEPARVFRELYSDILEDIVVPKHSRDRDFISQKIATTFCSQLMARGSRVAPRHKELLKYHSKAWKSIHSMSTCLSCLARQPSYALPCRHALCEACVVIHGRTTIDEPWSFAFDACPLCQSSAVRSISLKPPTAGVRGLTIDGGSIQDVLILKDLERQMQLPFDIRGHFDIALGSGLGALLLEIFCKEWPIEYCARHSQALNPVVLSEDVSEFDDTASDSKGRAAAVVSSLKAIFGQEPPLFQCATPVRIAVAALEAGTHTKCSFANYNLPELSRSENPKDELALWELARIVTSDTGILGYKARELHSNDLMNTAFWDQDAFWSRSQRPLDRLLCLGSPIRAPTHAEHQWITDCRIRKDLKSSLKLTADSLLASLFYIELVELPELKDRGISCKVVIVCRLSPSQPAYNAWVDRLRTMKARFNCHGYKIPCIDQHLHNEALQGIPFSRYTEFMALSLTSVIDVKLVGLGTGEYSISNCPYTVKTLIEDQGLHYVFGYRDHRDRFRYDITEIAEKGFAC